jgi:ABC-type glycerol-3-phosphate transport system permease component
MTAGQYGSPWETLFPSVLIAILPLIVIFLLFQKHFVKGVTAGAVKS